jgi:cytochrome c-type biogenesis protein CcmH
VARPGQSFKRWPAWVLLFFLAVALLAVGSTRDTGPRSPGDRVDDISRRVACPVCQGESVYESRNNASESIRAEIRAQVAEAERADDEIIEDIANRFGGEVLLVPRSTGIEALAWAIPAAALVCGVAGLAMAFRRWRVAAESGRAPTADDFTLVDAALASDERDADHGRDHDHDHDRDGNREQDLEP